MDALRAELGKALRVFLFIFCKEIFDCMSVWQHFGCISRFAGRVCVEERRNGARVGVAPGCGILTVEHASSKREPHCTFVRYDLEGRAHIRFQRSVPLNVSFVLFYVYPTTSRSVGLSGFLFVEATTTAAFWSRDKNGI